MLRNSSQRFLVSSTNRCLAAVTPPVSVTSVRFQSAWVAPYKRAPQKKYSQRRPFVNGKVVAFHVNDLKLDLQQHDFSSSILQSSTTNTNTKRTSSSGHPKREYDTDLIVILDMDECLIHSRFLTSPAEAAVYAHQLRNKHGDTDTTSAVNAVDSFRVRLPDNELVHVHVRPGLIEFLQAVTARYETHIFTAAMQVYAKPVLDHLCSAVRSDGDDGAPVFAGRWYREHCTWDPTNRAYVKDLSKLALRDQRSNSSLRKTVLVDNNPLSFLANPDNGILVNSFYTDASDNTLPAVLDLLQDLEGLEDVRPLLTEKFQLADALQSACPTRTASASVQATTTQQQQVAVA